MNLETYITQLPEIISNNYHVVVWAICLLAVPKAAWFYYVDLKNASAKARF